MRGIKLVAVFSLIVCFGAFGYLGWKVVKYNREYAYSGLDYVKSALFNNVIFKTKDSSNSLTINAVEVQKQGDYFILTNPNITIFQKGNRIEVKSDKLQTDQKICKLISNVNVKIANNISIKTEYAYVNIKLKFAKADNRIYITYNDVNAEADRYRLNMRQNLIELKNNVKIMSADTLLTGDHFRCYFKDNNGTKDVEKASINGNVIYKSNMHNFTTNGLVEFYQNTISFRSHTIINGSSGKKKYKLTTEKGDIVLLKNKVQRIHCKNNFKLFCDKNVVSGNRGSLENDIVNVDGNVIIKTPQGVARGQKARYNIKTGKLTMQGAGGVLFRKKKETNVAI